MSEILKSKNLNVKVFHVKRVLNKKSRFSFLVIGAVDVWHVQHMLRQPGIRASSKPLN